VSAGLLGDPPVGEVQPEPAPRVDRFGLSRGWLGTALAVLAVGVALRVHSPSALWLDEAISVDISSLPLGDVGGALRHDGAPPLYALLLWCWERLVGDSPHAVRLLSALFGVAALPVAALAGTRLAGRAAGMAALVLLATSPFAVYYSSEARMYSLVVLLVLCGVLALEGYLRRPAPARGIRLAAVTAALALTHYWSFFLIAVVIGGLLWRAWRSRDGISARATAWMAAGGLVFLPWLPSFLFQLMHTGTPWGVPPGFTAVLSTVFDWAGAFDWVGTVGAASQVLAVLLLVLAGIGATAGAVSGWRMELDLRGRTPGRELALTSFTTLVLALAVGWATGATFAPRYTSVALPLFLLAAAVGVARLPRRLGTAVLAVAVVAGLAGALPRATLYSAKTQAPVIAEALRAEAQPGDVVVYCPDQLGPSTSRLLPASLHQEVYPTGGSPERVDWVDYADRNRTADPVAYAQNLSARTPGAVWLVSSGGYRTYEGQCGSLVAALTALRGEPLPLVRADPMYFESADVHGWGPMARTAP
jgi:mannosyltransferase